MVCDHLRRLLGRGHSILVLGENVAGLKLIKRRMIARFTKFLRTKSIDIGIMTEGEHDKNIERLKRRLVLATYSMASEGIDADHLTTLFLYTPRSRVTQCVGRILRGGENMLNGKQANRYIIDVVDEYGGVFSNRWSKRRANCYDAIIPKTNIIERTIDDTTINY
jgi:superfamily II DNA or RNA helicase